MPEFREQLESAGGGRKLLISADETEIRPFLDEIEIALGDVPFGLIALMPNLKWLQLWSAGADFVQRFPALKELPFQLTTTSGIHRQQIAEHLFAMLLGWNRCLPDVSLARREHQWLFIKDRRLDVLNGKNMLIAGYGVIGEAVARIAAAFGMRVTGLRRDISKSPVIDGAQVEHASKIDSLLGEADHVVNILPFTPETRHYFGAERFGMMKNTALYINVGRGATTDQAALIDALNKKRIAGALLDVTDPEPLPGDSPLWDMDNVMITAHYAGSHPDYSRLAMAFALDNFERYNSGQPLKNLVDKQKGY